MKGSIELGGVTLWRWMKDDYAYDLKHQIFSILEGRHQKQTRKRVLDDVCLSFRSGERVGIIGPNGSGKSTLLKIICGILSPTSGAVRSEGTIAPLLELGVGFDPDLPVIENVLLYGVLMGSTRRQMMDRAESILQFAELTEYASVPVRVLSTGMAARLGFAIATDAQPDIFLLDEVLSVGDERFRKKCQLRIDTFWRGATTVLVVSHDLEFIRRSCDRAIWLSEGKVAFDGDSREAVRQYLASIDEVATQTIARLRAARAD